MSLVPDAPLSQAEITCASTLAGIGLALSVVIRPYDVVEWKAALVLTVLGLASGAGLFWLSLALLDLPRGRRAAGAVWAAVSWNILLLSQVPYVGFFMVPVEILIASAILWRRARVGTLWASVGLATVVRLASLVVVYAATAPMRQLFARG